MLALADSQLYPRFHGDGAIGQCRQGNRVTAAKVPAPSSPGLTRGSSSSPRHACGFTTVSSFSRGGPIIAWKCLPFRGRSNDPARRIREEADSQAREAKPAEQASEGRAPNKIPTTEPDSDSQTSRNVGISKRESRLSDAINRKAQRYPDRPINIDAEAIKEFEGTKNKAYVPGDKSGVTIASGMDLGWHSERELRDMGMPEKLIQKFKPYLKKEGQNHILGNQARALLKENPIILSNEEVNIVNEIVMTDKLKKTINHYDSMVNARKSEFPGAKQFHELTPAQQTVLFSRYYHAGAGWTGWTRKNKETDPGSGHHPGFLREVLNGDWVKAEQELGKEITRRKNMQGQTGTAARLEKERVYLTRPENN